MARVAGPGCSAGDPPWALCRHACHWLLPWLRVTFIIVFDAARPGSDQWPWSTAPATGPGGRQGVPSASDPWGVVCCALSLCRPPCPGPLRACSPVCTRRVLCCVCAVLGHLAPVQRCARLVLLPWGRSLCLCFVFFPRPFFWCPRPFVFAFFPRFFKRRKNGQGARKDCKHRHGHLGQLCSSAVFLIVLAFFRGSRPRGAARASRCTWARVGVGSVGRLCASWFAWWCRLLKRMCWLWAWALVPFCSGGLDQARKVTARGAWFVFVGRGLASAGVSGHNWQLRQFRRVRRSRRLRAWAWWRWAQLVPVGLCAGVHRLPA